MASDAEVRDEAVPAGHPRRCDLAHDLALPTLLFAALGGMTWAVRGCSGFGAVAGCVFAGVTWGAAWWFLAQPLGEGRTRRYSSGWVVLALTVGVGLSGARGWMQWPSFFEGKLMTNAPKGEFVPIPRAYGFLWLFLAGVPWAGLGACLLAWCGSRRETRAWHWLARVGCGLGGALLARHLFHAHPESFLPLYDALEPRYRDLAANPSLRRLTNDCGSALTHLGCYLGLLLFEAGRRDGKNVVLIATAGLVNGAGWALCQNWKWANAVWGADSFNFWRCWESSGGVSIGVAYGLAYFLVNRETDAHERAALAARRSIAGPGFEWLLVHAGLAWLLSLLMRSQMGGWGDLYFSGVILIGTAYVLRTQRPGAATAWASACLGAATVAGLLLPGRREGWSGLAVPGTALALGFAWYLSRRAAFDDEAAAVTPVGGDERLERLGLSLGLLTGLGLSVRNGLKGWCNLYLGNEDYWGRRLWDYLGPTYLAVLAAVGAWLLLRPRPSRPGGIRFPEADRVIWLVLVVQNVIAQLVTGPHSRWSETAFSLYYLLLFLISAVIVFHFHAMRRLRA